MSKTIKIPVHDDRLEKAVLGMILISKDAIYAAMPKLFDELFYVTANRVVFIALRQLFDVNSQIDYFTVYSQIKKNGDESELEGVGSLTKLESNITATISLETHINILSEYYIKRELSKSAAAISEKCYLNESDPFELIKDLTNNIQNISENVLNGRTKDVVFYVTEMLKQYTNVRDTGVLGIKTGIYDIDKWIGGLVSPDVIVIAGRPGQGKTALALSITHELTIKNNIPGAWFSFEMDGIQLVRRLISMDSGVDHQKIKQGFTDTREEKNIYDSSSVISEKKLFIEDNPTMTIRDIRAKSLMLHKKYGIQYIVVDYLQLINSDDRYSNREQIVAEISRNLKIIAKELNIPVIALSQLNRGVESRADKRPTLSDLRESGSIEQDADVVLLLMRPEYYKITEFDDKPAQNLGVLFLEKNRHGKTGILYTYFDGSKMQFSTYKNI